MLESLKKAQDSNYMYCNTFGYGVLLEKLIAEKWHQSNLFHFIMDNPNYIAQVLKYTDKCYSSSNENKILVLMSAIKGGEKNKSEMVKVLLDFAKGKILTCLSWEEHFTTTLSEDYPTEKLIDLINQGKILEESNRAKLLIEAQKIQKIKEQQHKVLTKFGFQFEKCAAQRDFVNRNQISKIIHRYNTPDLIFEFNGEVSRVHILKLWDHDSYHDCSYPEIAEYVDLADPYLNDEASFIKDLQKLEAKWELAVEEHLKEVKQELSISIDYPE